MSTFLNWIRIFKCPWCPIFADVYHHHTSKELNWDRFKNSSPSFGFSWMACHYCSQYNHMLANKSPPTMAWSYLVFEKASHQARGACYYHWCAAILWFQATPTKNRVAACEHRFQRLLVSSMYDFFCNKIRTNAISSYMYFQIPSSRTAPFANHADSIDSSCKHLKFLMTEFHDTRVSDTIRHRPIRRFAPY